MGEKAFWIGCIMIKKKSKEDTRKFVEMAANHNGWKLNRDKEFLEMLIEGLTINQNRYGQYFCPCRDSWGTIEKDKDIVCPCDYCVPDQKDYGHCYCGLFLTKEFYNSGKETKSIPERRDQSRFP